MSRRTPSMPGESQPPITMFATARSRQMSNDDVEDDDFRVSCPCVFCCCSPLLLLLLC